MLFDFKVNQKEIRPKFVTTVHGFYSVNYFSSIMTKGDAVICVSNSIREYVLENYPKTSSIILMLFIGELGLVIITLAINQIKNG